MAAYAIDVALLFAVLAPLAFVGQWLTGHVPDSPHAAWSVQLLHFSLPAWTYFFAADRSARGATLGKRWLGLRVAAAARARARTALKLLPWELTHLSGFALGEEFGVLTPTQVVGLVLANVLAAAWLLLAAFSRGACSAHDRICGTRVERT